MKASTKTAPFDFFWYILNEKNYKKHEKDFYDIEDSVSAIDSFRDEGYRVLHIFELDIDGEITKEEVQTQYFDEMFKSMIEHQANVSYDLINERIKEFIFENKEYDKYLIFHIHELTRLKGQIQNLKRFKPNFKLLLDELEDKLIELHSIDNSKLNLSRSKNYSSKKVSFFGAEKLKNKHLIELYQISIKYDIIDDEVMTENDFIKFFTSENPYIDKLHFRFNCNNIFAINYIDKLKVLFSNLSYSTITKSESFFNKGKTLLKQSNLDNMPKNSKRDLDKKRLDSLNLELDNLIDKIQK